jgi:hypothetical protein
MKHGPHNPACESACPKNFMTCASDLNGNGQLVSHGRLYKVALQLPLNVFMKFDALPFIFHVYSTRSRVWKNFLWALTHRISFYSIIIPKPSN